MAAITESDFSLCYDLGVKVVKGQLDFKAAVKEATRAGMNSTSASDYIRTVEFMTEGRTFKRAINANAVELYLSNIQTDFGPGGLRSAIEALSGHIEYYESFKRGKLRTLAEVRDRFSKAYSNSRVSEIDYLTEDLSGAFQTQITAAALLSKKDRETQLKQWREIPQRLSVLTTAFRRNPYVVAERLSISEGKCEGCNKSAPFFRDDGTAFLEVHHITPLSEGGLDTIENTMALCPNCHREAHFGSDRARFRE
ncbi:HNH endonuclease [Marinovum sp.]|uniref:HNH endonuclease n=1 Tax=Marinovum sp. TaxID=2024839 RepID=UPI002B26E35C|nr:HNH endonuclease [Marinovum sp.]